MMYVTLYLTAMNVLAFVLFGADKKRAQNDQWRIPEKHLLLSAAAGGSLGAFMGMYFFRHKTKKRKFCTLVPLFLAIHYLFFSRFF